MNRLNASMSVIGLAFLAVVVCVGQTLPYSGSAATALLAVELTIGVLLIALLVMLLMRARPPRNASGRGFAIVQPLRRLLAAVWS